MTFYYEKEPSLTILITTNSLLTIEPADKAVFNLFTFQNIEYLKHKTVNNKFGINLIF